MSDRRIDEYIEEAPTQGARALGLNEDNVTRLLLLSAVAPAGMLAPFAMATSPDGWFACDGSAVSRTTYSALFDAIGTTWGAGDGSTTFNVPDLQGAFVRGTGTGTIDTRDKVGPSVGAFQEDAYQGHWHDVRRRSDDTDARQASATGPTGSGTSWVSSSTGQPLDARYPLTDTVNGTPRTGTETRPYAAGVLWCIKT